MKDTVKKLKDIIKNVPITEIKLPDGASIHSIFKSEGVEGLRSRSIGEYVDFEEISHFKEAETMELIKLYDHKLLFQTTNIDYYILGSLSQDLSTLKVTILAEIRNTGKKERIKIDLYEREAVRNFAIQLRELTEENTEKIEVDLLRLTDTLEHYRDTQIQASIPLSKHKQQFFTIPPQREHHCIEFLKQENVLKHIDEKIELSGVVGEERIRTLLFVIALTYKMNAPLHVLVIGESGSGKSHIVNAIATLVPQEDVLNITRVSSKSFYHYSNDELVNKVLLIQDFEGLNEEAEYAFRELQSAGSITSSTTSKDKQGNLQAQIKTVRAHFSSLGASTKELYFDNMSRSIVIGIDESIEQTQRIINYQNKVIAGRVNMHEVHHARLLLQDCIRSLKQEEVINPYAEKIQLPIEAKMQRRLNMQYQSTVKAVTLLHQFQRTKDNQGRLISEIEDLQIACDLLFPALMLKVDDLDSSLRQFFDSLKAYIKTTNTHFSQLDIRKALHTSKTQCFRYMTDLERLGYIQKVGGHVNKGYKYKIVYFDDMNMIREKIKKELNEQIDQLKQR